MTPILGFLGAAAGGLAKAATSLFSGDAREARKQRREEKREVKTQKKAAEKAVKTATERAKVADIQSEETKINFQTLAKKYWWVAAVLAGLIFLPKLLGLNPGRSRRASSRGSSWSRSMLAAKRRKARSRKK